MPTITLTGDERQDFTITHPQKIKISGRVSAGKSAIDYWLGQHITERHPVQAKIQNKRTGSVVFSQNSGERGSKSLSETIQVSAGNYVALIAGAGRGDHHPSFGKMTVKYSKKTSDESSDDGAEEYFSGIGEVTSVVDDLSEKIGISPLYLGIGGVILLLIFLR